MVRNLSKMEVDCIARGAHEVNRAFNALLGDYSYPHWEEADDWVKVNARGSVLAIAELECGAKALHQDWVKTKLADGWTLGEKKDFANKIHPCLVPYEELPEHHRIKDDMWISVVKTMVDALWRIPQ